jgi:hypothetical protein
MGDTEYWGKYLTFYILTLDWLELYGSVILDCFEIYGSVWKMG